MATVCRLRPKATPFSVSPFLEAATALMLLFLPFWALWRLTEWLCPPAAALCRWTARQSRLAVRAVARWTRETLWRQPARRYGAVATAWLWLLGIWLMLFVVALQTGRTWQAVESLPWLALLLAGWQLLRWRQERQFRPRPLPTRQGRRGHD